MKILFGATAAAVLLAGVMGLASVGPAAALTNKECDAQWHSDPAGKAAGMKFKDYKAAHCAGDAMAPAAAPAPAAAAPAPAPAAAAPAPKPAAAAPMAPAAPMAKGAKSTAGEYASESEAKGHCPSDTVVWVNTKTRKWHVSGDRYYGKTKHGAYECQQEAAAKGDEAAK